MKEVINRNLDEDKLTSLGFKIFYDTDDGIEYYYYVLEFYEVFLISTSSDAKEEGFFSVSLVDNVGLGICYNDIEIKNLIKALTRLDL